METGNGKKLLQRIGERGEEFSPKQRLIAEYILKNYLDLAYATVAEFAHGAGVSDATVIRFVYSLGFHDFSDFMGHLRKEIEDTKAGRATSLERHIFDKENYNFPDDIMRAIFSLEISVMEETLAKNSTETFSEAVDRIHGSSMVLIIGCETNRSYAQAMHFALDVLRANVKTIEKLDSSAKGLIESIPQNTTCIVFSTPRYPCETQSVLKELKDCPNKPFIIGITDSVLSPIAPYSDLVFQIPQKFVIFVGTNAAYMALIHSIAFGLYLKNPAQSKKRIVTYDSFVKKHNFYVKDYLELIDF